MTPESEIASPASGSNGRDGSDATITSASDTKSKSITSNGGQGHAQGGCTIRGDHQVRDERFGCFNRPAYISSIRNLKG